LGVEEQHVRHPDVDYHLPRAGDRLRQIDGRQHPRPTIPFRHDRSHPIPPRSPHGGAVASRGRVVDYDPDPC
jgi:hypothetical protein